MRFSDIIAEQMASGDGFELEIGDCLIETVILGFTQDGVIVETDLKALALLKAYGAEFNKVAVSQLDEAEYHGRNVPLGKPMAGDVKKSKVYVRGPKGNVVKVNFGDKNMRIKKSNPKRRKSFRARHHCENPGPRWKARYWSCRAW